MIQFLINWWSLWSGNNVFLFIIGGLWNIAMLYLFLSCDWYRWNLIIFFMPQCSTIILGLSKTKHRNVFWPMYSKSISSSVTCLNKYYLKESRQIYSSLLGFNLLCSMQGWKNIKTKKYRTKVFVMGYCTNYRWCVKLS